MPSKSKGNMDFTLLITVLLLLAIGVTMVFSASSVSTIVKDESGERYIDKYSYLRSQGSYAIIGIIAMLVLSNINYKFIGKFAVPLVLVSLVLLIIIFVPGIGYGAKGALRWIKIGPLTMQPSEFAKTAIIIFMARSLSFKKGQVRDFFRGVVPYILLMSVYCLLIILEPNKSMAINIAMIVFIMLFAAGAKIWHLAIWGAPLVPAALYIIMRDSYSLARITSYLDPWSDPLKSGYQAIQSLLALGSGGIFGMGLGKSRQKFFYIPEAQNDFIFSIIGEELGFIGAATIIVLFMILVWRGIRIALACQDTYGSLLATGITCMIALQVVLNIAVVTVTIPTTGVTLPLISSGGSSLVMVMSNIGILLNISKTIKVNAS